MPKNRRVGGLIALLGDSRRLLCRKERSGARTPLREQLARRLLSTPSVAQVYYSTNRSTNPQSTGERNLATGSVRRASLRGRGRWCALCPAQQSRRDKAHRTPAGRQTGQAALEDSQAQRTRGEIFPLQAGGGSGDAETVDVSAQACQHCRAEIARTPDCRKRQRRGKTQVLGTRRMLRACLRCRQRNTFHRTDSRQLYGAAESRAGFPHDENGVARNTPSVCAQRITHARTCLLLHACFETPARS